MSGAAPSPARVRAQTAFEVRALARNGEQLLVSLVLPLLALVVIVAVAPDALGAGRFSARPVDVAVPGVLAVAVVSTAFTGQAIALAYERRYGVLRLLGTTPLGRRGLMAGKGGAVLVVVALQYVAIGAAGLALGWRPQPIGLLVAALLALAGIAAFGGLALLVGGALRAEAVLAVANLAWVLFLGCGLLLPLAALPDPLATILSLTPPGALGEGLRAATLGEPAAAILPAAVLWGWAGLTGYLASRTLRWSD